MQSLHQVKSPRNPVGGPTGSWYEVFCCTMFAGDRQGLLVLPCLGGVQALWGRENYCSNVQTARRYYSIVITVNLFKKGQVIFVHGV